MNSLVSTPLPLSSPSPTISPLARVASASKPSPTRGLDGISRVLVIASGHSYSTLDAYTGLVEGFKRAGIAAWRYDLHKRISGSREWLEFARARFGSPNDPEPTMDDILYQAGVRAIVKALEVNADAVVMVCGLLIDPRLYVLFERMGMPVWLYGTESPYDDDMMKICAKLVTVASTNERTSVDKIRAAVEAGGEGTPVEYLPLGYNPAIHVAGFGANVPDVPSHDVVFVGNFYPSRTRLLEAVDWAGADVGLYGVWNSVPLTSPLQSFRRGGVVDNRFAAILYNRAKVCINLFRTEKLRDITEVLEDGLIGESLNPRMIECAAAGNFMVSEYRPEVADVFGDAVPTFKTAGELSELLAYYLAHDSAREALAARLPDLVAGWSYEARARTIVAGLERTIGSSTLR